MALDLSGMTDVLGTVVVTGVVTKVTDSMFPANRGVSKPVQWEWTNKGWDFLSRDWSIVKKLKPKSQAMVDILTDMAASGPMAKSTISNRHPGSLYKDALKSLEKGHYIQVYKGEYMRPTMGGDY